MNVKFSRAAFDQIYDTEVVSAGFFETNEYYRIEKERYWRSLCYIADLHIPKPAKIFEIGGGQISIFRKLLFDDPCTVGDISRRYSTPIERHGINFVEYNLLDTHAQLADTFDLIVALEVIEHVPLPAYVLLERLKRMLRPGGIIFLTTPNLFRIRNLARMFLGKEFLDPFLLPNPGDAPGHQLEYSATHLKWQVERAGMELILMQHDELGRKGHSSLARVGRLLSRPATFRRAWRESLVVAAIDRKESDAARSANGSW